MDKLGKLIAKYGRHTRDGLRLVIPQKKYPNGCYSDGLSKANKSALDYLKANGTLQIARYGWYCHEYKITGLEK